jgi:hypothetical protein
VAGLKIRLGKLAFSFLPLEQGFQTFLCIVPSEDVRKLGIPLLLYAHKYTHS